jgi:glucose/arabinose dehydrogenase
MKTPCVLLLFGFAVVLFLAACESSSRVAVERSVGETPTLPEPNKSLVPTVNIAPAKGWASGAEPVAAEGLSVNAFATGLDHPRWLYVLLNGDVLVAETNAPERPEYGKSIKGAAMRLFMKRAGAATPSANRILLLRDADRDGVAETKHTFLSGLNSPFGIAVFRDQFYVANTDAVLRFPYREGATEITGPGTKVADLPAGPINQHWTRSLVANRDGSRLYVGVGSSSNVAEHGIEKEANRACVLEINPANGLTRVFASGLRNPVGLAWQPQSGELWATVNERDELGNDLVPDYMTALRDAAFYGWPYAYFGQHVDDRVEPQRPDLVAKAIVPDYALGAHTAPLGLTFLDRDQEPWAERYAGGAFIGQHGSWNRAPLSGYKVIFVPFRDGRPAGPPEDILTGFLDAKENAQGRPVGVAFDRHRALLVADDVGNVIWRVTPATAAAK